MPGIINKAKWDRWKHQKSSLHAVSPVHHASPRESARIRVSPLRPISTASTPLPRCRCHRMHAKRGRSFQCPLRHILLPLPPYQPCPPFVPPAASTRDIKARAISGGGGGRGCRKRVAAGDDSCGGGGAVLDMIGCQKGLIQGSATPRRVSIHPSPIPCGAPSGWPRGCASS